MNNVNNLERVLTRYIANWWAWKASSKVHGYMTAHGGYVKVSGKVHGYMKAPGGYVKVSGKVHGYMKACGSQRKEK
jgi:hypothetical protein